jgi:hypothetical protein
MHMLTYCSTEATDSMQTGLLVNGLCKNVLELNCTVHLTVYFKTRASKLFMAKAHARYCGLVRGLYV